MCDTMVALGPATATGATLFAKNSDRHPNEAQAVVRIPGATHPAGAAVRCTYVSVPQVARTHAALLCKPFWIWGAGLSGQQGNGSTAPLQGGTMSHPINAQGHAANDGDAPLGQVPG